MNKSEIIQYCINRATECIELIPQATETERSRLFEIAEHWLKLGQRAVSGEDIENLLTTPPRCRMAYDAN
jgi:hypothetical protein